MPNARISTRVENRDDPNLLKLYTIINAIRELLNYSHPDISEHHPMKLRHNSDPIQNDVYRFVKSFTQADSTTLIKIVRLVVLMLSFGIEDHWQSHFIHLARAAARTVSQGVPREGSASASASLRSNSARNAGGTGSASLAS